MPSRRRPVRARPDARNRFVSQTGRSLAPVVPAVDQCSRYTRLTSIMAALDQGIAFVNPDGLVLEVNDRYLDLCRQSRANILGHGLASLGLETEDYQASAFLDLFRRGVAHAAVTFNQRLGERDVTVKLQPVREADAFTGIIVSVIDVTALVEARVSVEREKHYLEQVITIAGAAICIVNREDVVVTINDEFTAITGYDRETALGRPRQSLLRETPPSPCPAAAAPGSAVQKRQSQILTRDRRRLTILKNAASILDAQGEPSGGIESFVDVTDLIRARLEAEQTSRLKSAFLANMSHEIRTPLNAIMGLAQLLNRTGLTEDQRECVSTMQAAGEDLLVILNDVLDFSRIESGRMEVRPASVSLASLLETLRRIMMPAAMEKGLSLETDLDPLLPRHVQVDPVRLKQVLLNLLQNAIKFTEKGQVSLSVRCLATPDLSRTSLPVRFLVRDTGAGIPAAMLDRIFEPFVQVGDPLNRPQGGTGLGLSIANRLVRLLGAPALEVTSQEGHGSVFSFTLRLHEPEAGRCIPEDDDVRPLGLGFDGLRALVAEDNAFNRFLLGKILEKIGLPAPDNAPDGARALEMILAQEEAGTPYDVVFMDVRMPGLDGLEVCRRVREAHIATPIVALTAQAAPDDAARCREAGMTAYFSKPYRISDLENVLRGFLPPLPSGGN